jgi:hypothetical protein
MTESYKEKEGDACHGDANHFFQVIDMYWRSTECDSLFHRSRQLKKDDLRPQICGTD